MKKLLLLLVFAISTTMLFAGGDSEKQQETSTVELDINEDGTINNPEDVKVDKDKLVLWSLFSGGDGEYFDQIIDSYNATKPSKQVQSIMLVWADYYTKLMTGVAAKKGPDIGISHVSRLPLLYSQGIIEPIDKYSDKANIDWSKYTDGMNASVTFDNMHYAMPLDTHAEILYYNKDWLDKAGISLKDGKLDINSSSDFENILMKLTKVAGDGQSALALPQQNDDPYRIWWALYFQMNGTPLVNSDGTKITLDKDVAIKALTYLKSLYNKGYILEGIVDHQAMFQSGDAGLLFGGTWATGVFAATDGLNFGAQAMPKLFDNDSCWADAHVLIIPVNKDRTEEETQAAVDFIHYVSTEGATTWAMSGQIPSNLEVQEAQDYLDLPYRSDYKKAASTAVLPPQSEYFNALYSVMNSNLNKHLSDATTAEVAISEMIEELQEEIM